MATYEMTELYLLNVPLENDYLHTLYFANKSAQTNYFKSKAVLKETDFSYQRKDSVIRYPAEYDDLLKCNYVMYRNTAYGDKWFYAFITKLEYISEGMTKIFIETDVMQTWAFDYTVKTSFVEREHVNNDRVGLNTVPEQVETGEYVCSAETRNPAFNSGSFVIGVTVDLNSSDLDNVGGKKYNGVYSGVRYYVMEQTQLNETIVRLADAGKSDAITCIFCCPSSNYFCTTTIGTKGYAEVDASDRAYSFNWSDELFVGATTPPKPTHLDGYVPKNKKLFTSPYCYMLMSNNAGGSAIYQYEHFYSETCDFTTYLSITPGFSIRMIPRYYKGIPYNYEEGINCGKYPICNWNTDVYTNWLTQNSVNIGVSMLTGAGQIIGGVAMGTTLLGAPIGAGAISHGVYTIASTIGEVYQHRLQPAQAEGNLNSGDVTYSMGSIGFTAYQMTIKKEYARIIDEYFTAYGYKVNRFKVPHKNHRTNFWYTKCIDVNIDGAIPMEDMQKIKNCYNTGITFWKNPANIQNYSVTNSIV